MNWIKANPMWAAIIAGVIIIVAVAFISGFFGYLDRKAERHDEVVKNSGELQERQKSNEETFNAVRNAQRPVTYNELDGVREKYDRSRR